MAELVVDLSFPHSPITSLQKQIGKGIEQLYYAKLFLTSPTYADGKVWKEWYDRGFHIAIFSPPPGTVTGDKIRVRMRAPSPTPRVEVTGGNVDALKDLETLLGLVDVARPQVAGAGEEARADALRGGELGRLLVSPLVDALGQAGLEASGVDAYVAMLQRGFDALTHDDIRAVVVSMR